MEAAPALQATVVDELQKLPVPTRSPNHELDAARDRAPMGLIPPSINQAGHMRKVAPSHPEVEFQKLPVPQPVVQEDVPSKPLGRHTDAQTERWMLSGTRSPRLQQNRGRVLL